jgi:hypothetical protein
MAGRRSVSINIIYCCNRGSSMIRKRIGGRGLCGSSFIKSVMDAYNDYRMELGILDVYVYEVPGKSVKATAMIILKGGLAPVTLTIYCMANESIIALMDVSNKVNMQCNGNSTHITIDLYQPPEEAQLCITDKGKYMLAAAHEFNEDKTYLMKIINGHMDSILMASLIKELMDIYASLASSPP